MYDNIVISVTDGKSTASLPPFRIVVDGINYAPRFTAGANQNVCTNAGGQLAYNWATGITDGNLETQQLEFITTHNSNPELFGGLLGFGGKPYVSPEGVLSYRGALNVSGQTEVCVQLKDNGGTEFNGHDTAPEQCFTIAIDPNCDDGAGELFNPGQFDFDPIGGFINDGSGSANLDLNLNFGYTSHLTDNLSDVGNIPLASLDGIGNIPLNGITGVQAPKAPQSPDIPFGEVTPFSAEILNQSATPGSQVVLSLQLGAQQRFINADKRCAIDIAKGLATCYLDSVSSGKTRIGFSAQAPEGQTISARASLRAANDKEFRDNTAELQANTGGSDGLREASTGDSGGGSLGWLSLLGLFALRRRLAS